jgi:hypothetical protein
MNELGDSLERMSFMQLLLLFGFVTTYVVALGGLFGSAVRLRAAGAALVLAGLGLFVMLSWLLARLLGPRPLPVEAPADTASDSSTLPSQPSALRASPKLGRRARATR